MTFGKVKDFIKKRLAFGETYGLFFTVGMVLSGLFLFLFAMIAEDVLEKSSLLAFDTGLLDLVVSLRNIGVANFFLFFTYLGNWQVIASMGILIFIVLSLLRRNRMMMFFGGTVVIGEVMNRLFKFLFSRARPDIAYSLIERSGNSFPSGHATLSVIFYGTIGYILWRVLKSKWQKAFIAFVFTILVFLIGFSRIYLGVHWPSDVVAGWVIGFSVLIFFATFYAQSERFNSAEQNEFLFSKKTILIISLIFFLAESAFIFFFYNSNPLLFNL